jgi:hypothetical protein
MSLPSTFYPKFNLVAIPTILEELFIEFAPGYLMNGEKLGIPLRKALVKQLYTMQEDTLAINMSSIEEITSSVAEEIGPKLFQELIRCREKHREVYLTYFNVTEGITRGLDGTFRNWGAAPESPEKLNIVVFSTFQNGVFSGHQFLGQEIPAALKDVLDVIYSFGVVNSSDLEEKGIKAASRKLNELARYYPWLFRKIQKSLDTSSRAWAYFYSPIVPVAEKIGAK